MKERRAQITIGRSAYLNNFPFLFSPHEPVYLNNVPDAFCYFTVIFNSELTINIPKTFLLCLIVSYRAQLQRGHFYYKYNHEKTRASKNKHKHANVHFDFLNFHVNSFMITGHFIFHALSPTFFPYLTLHHNLSEALRFVQASA